MFGFPSRQERDKEIALPLRVVIESPEDGLFLAKVPGLPGCTARGRSRAEALRNAEQAVRLRLAASAPADFEPVWEDPSRKVIHCVVPYFGRLVAGTNRDATLLSTSGDFGSWGASAVVGEPGGGRPGLDGAPPAEGEDGDLPDFTPQIYCLAAYGGSGVSKLYAGTSSGGAVYESLDGASWELSSATGEDRVHFLAEFRGRLYAGTSGSGKLFSYTGAHWSLVHRSPETALVSAAEFNGELFVGTYPNGHVYASADGIHWHLALDSGQTFVRALAAFGGSLYAATSRASGGAVYRSANGLRWDRVLATKDPNLYCLQEFQGALWLGSGNHGRLYRSPDGAAWSVAGALEDEGIRGMAAFGGRLILATEGRGRLYRSAFADTPPPVVSDVRVRDVTSHSAVVSWSTDRPADSRVLYGVDALGDGVHAAAPVTEHRLALAYLKARTVYRVRALSRGTDAGEAGFSEECSFTTLDAERVDLESPTHPEDRGWSRQPDAVMRWVPPPGALRFYWSLDRAPDSLPEAGGAGVGVTGGSEVSFTLPADGLWWFHLRCEDRAGNLGALAAHYCLRLDTQALPPALRSLSHPVAGAWSNLARAVFAWQDPEDLSGIIGYHVALDRRPDTVPGPGAGEWITVPRHAADMDADGEWWFHALSQDAAGNLGAEAAHYCLRLDRRAAPPRVESPTHPDPALWCNTTQAALAWEAPEDLSGIVGYYTLLDRDPGTVPDAQTGAFTASPAASYEGLADGVWWFHVVSVDRAGNVGVEAGHRCLRVDTWAAPPVVTSPTHPAGAWASSARAVFEWEPPQDLSGVTGYYTLLDREPLGLPGPGHGTHTTAARLEFDALADGVWWLHVASQDAAGNVGVEAAHCRVAVDTEAPTPSPQAALAGGAWAVSRRVAVSWEPVEDLSGVARYLWRLDRSPDAPPPTGRDGIPCPGPGLEVEVPDDGVWWFQVVAQDRAGNLSAAAGRCRLQVDTAALPPPNLASPTHPDAAAWSARADALFTWDEPADDSGVAGYHWVLDRQEGTVPGPGSGTFTAQRAAETGPVPGEGQWWFHVATLDKAGNSSVSASHRPLRVDLQAGPPAVRSPSHGEAGDWKADSAPEFEWDEPADLSGVAGYYHRLDRAPGGGAPTASDGTWTEGRRAAFSGLADGEWHFAVSTRDRCGNVGPLAGRCLVRVDTVAAAPRVSSPTHAPGVWSSNAAATLAWDEPQDDSGVAEYRAWVDRVAAPAAVPAEARATTARRLTLPPLDDGVWHFHVVAVDKAGNLSPPAHWGLLIDTSAAPARLSSPTHPDPALWYRDPEPRLEWEAPAEPSGVEGYFWSLDRAPDTVPGSSDHWTTGTRAAPGPLPDGEWWFHLATKDGAGNVSAKAAHLRLNVVTAVPRPRLHSPTHPDPGTWVASDRPRFVWDQDPGLAGVAGAYWTFDRDPDAAVVPGRARWTVAREVTLPAQADGVWTFAVAAKDRAGNLSEPARLAVRIATRPPATRLEPLPEVTRGPEVALRWSVEAPACGLAHVDVQVRVAGRGDWRDLKAGTRDTAAVYRARDGERVEFRARAVDNAGNVEPWPGDGAAAASTLVDCAPPGPVAGLRARPGAGGTVALSWSAARDDASGVAGYEVWRSMHEAGEGLRLSPDGGVAGTSFTDPGAGLPDGAAAFYWVVPFDRAGNRGQAHGGRVPCLCLRTARAPMGVESPTHPRPGAWSGEARALVRWTPPEGPLEPSGYLWTLDRSPETAPRPPEAAFTRTPEAELPDLEDGAWFIHVATRDAAGNVSEGAVHYPLNVDRTPPPPPAVRCLTHTQDDWSAVGDAVFEWDEPVDASGVAGYHWTVDGRPGTVPGPGRAEATDRRRAEVAGLDDGEWWFHVAAVDGAGNAGAQAGHFRVRIARTLPPPRVSSPTHPRPDESYPNATAVVQWAPAEGRDGGGWRYGLDQVPDTVPGEGAAVTAEPRVEFADLGPGDWWFHVLSLGPEGRAGTVAAHFPLRVRPALALHGQVTKPNGMLPQEGAQVEVFRRGRSVGRAVSGADGRFRFEGLEPGELLVKLDVAGQPPLLVEGVRLAPGFAGLSLSPECMAWPSPTAGAGQVRFAVLARAAGLVALKLYSENGRALAEMEAAAARPSYVKLAWDCAQVPPGIVLWQASLVTADGKTVKLPLRKLKITS